MSTDARTWLKRLRELDRPAGIRIMNHHRRLIPRPSQIQLDPPCAGGHGAVREICDLILAAQGLDQAALDGVMYP